MVSHNNLIANIAVFIASGLTATSSLFDTTEFRIQSSFRVVKYVVVAPDSTAAHARDESSFFFECNGVNNYKNVFVRALSGQIAIRNNSIGFTPSYPSLVIRYF